MNAMWLLVPLLVCSCATGPDVRQHANDMRALANAVASELDMAREVIKQRCSEPCDACERVRIIYNAAVTMHRIAQDTIDYYDSTGTREKAAANAVQMTRDALALMHDQLGSLPR